MFGKGYRGQGRSYGGTAPGREWMFGSLYRGQVRSYGLHVAHPPENHNRNPHAAA